MKLKNLFLIGITSLSLLITSCTKKNAQQPEPNPVTNQANSTQELTNINVCYSSKVPAHIMAWYAQENNIFAKYGLKVNLTYVNGGSTAATVLISKEMNFCQMAGDSVIYANLANQDLVMIAGFYNTYPASLMVKPEITKINDLKGKTLANHNKPGGITDSVFRLLLKKSNLKPDQDVKLLPVGDQAERLMAMESNKEIVGTLLTVPFNLKAEKQGYQELINISDIDLVYQYIGMVTTKSYLAENPEIATNLLKAILEAISLIKEDKEGTIKVMAKYLNLDIEKDAEELNSSYEVFVTKYLETLPLPSLEGMQTIFNNLDGSNTSELKLKPEDVIDTTIINKLK